MPAADLAAQRREIETVLGRSLSDAEFASYLMYPKVFRDFAFMLRKFGDVSILPTPVFFYGMEPGQEITLEMEKGKSLVLRFLALAEADENGLRKVFFELNGQPRTVRIADKSAGRRICHARC